MHRLLMMLAAASLTLAGQSALAEQRPDGPPPECRQQDRKCPPLARHGKRDDRPASPARHKADDRRHEDRRDARPRPHVGENARAGRPWTPPRDSRMARAPRGQEYRVIGDHLVLVDQKSHRILSVLAPVKPR